MLTKKLSSLLTSTLCTAGIAVAVAPAFAQDPAYTKRTIYTFSQPVEIPGATLQPGQYEFRLAAPESNRTVIQVRSADGKEVFGTFHTMPINAPDPVAESEVRLIEAPPGQPQAVRAMWYIGERIGREFVYPRTQAARIARNATEPVLTTTAAVTRPEDANTTNVARLDQSGRDMPATSASSDANAGANTAAPPVTNREQGQVAANTAAQAPAPSASSPAGTVPNPEPRAPQQVAQNRTELPQTAGPVAAIAMMSAMAFGVAAAMRYRRQRATKKAHR
jgi:hypothetical protein